MMLANGSAWPEAAVAIAACAAFAFMIWALTR